jgi:DNA-binding IclR family transcriptional regulator
MLTKTTEDSLTGRALEMLDALRQSGEWMSRAQIAHASGKKALIPYDKELLERMVEGGFLEKRQRASNTPVGIAYEYKAK